MSIECPTIPFSSSGTITWLFTERFPERLALRRVSSWRVAEVFNISTYSKKSNSLPPSATLSFSRCWTSCKALVLATDLCSKDFIMGSGNCISNESCWSLYSSTSSSNSMMCAYAVFPDDELNTIVVSFSSTSWALNTAAVELRAKLMSFSRTFWASQSYLC